MGYTPKYLELWQRAENYGGDDFSNYYVCCGRSRDSKLLEESNFEAAKLNLRADKRKTVRVVRFGHWAVGWIETILVRKDAPEHIIKEADEIGASLESYPILDESDYNERVRQEQERLWKDSSLRERIRLAVDKGESKFVARREYVSELPDSVEGYLRELAEE